MTGRTVHRLDRDGTIRDWLVGEVWSWPADDLAEHVDPDGSPWEGADGREARWVLTNGPDVAPLKTRLYAAHPLPEEPPPDPVEGGRFHWAGLESTWRRVRTAPDGLVDFSDFSFTPTYRVALAGTLLEVDQAEIRTLQIGSTGPVVVFVDGRPLARDPRVTYMEPLQRNLQVRLPSGTSTLVIACWQVAFRECRQVVSARVHGLPARVVVPSPGADERVAAWAETVLHPVGAPRWAAGGDEVGLTVPPGLPETVPLTVSANGHRLPVTRERDRLRVRLALPGDAGVGNASMLTTGGVRLRVQVDDPRAPVFREVGAATVPPAWRGTPEGSPETWRREFLEHAAGTAEPGPGTVGSELAAVALGAETIRPSGLERALWMLAERADCADFEALGLLNLLHRAPASAWPEKLREQVVTALRGAKYWIDQPGLDVQCYFTENHQLAWHVAETLAGELLDGETFANTGWSGARHAEHGAALAEQWMTRRLRGGFSEFDSNAYMAIDLLALCSLVEHCRRPRLTELAEALLDKLLFLLAINSWRGLHVSSHGRSYVQTLRSARLEETAPIQWVAWGMGSLNSAVLPATVLATARRYTIPDAVRAAAQRLPESWWAQQRFHGTYLFEHDLLARDWDSHTVMWKTPDVLLASAQDYRSGLPGLQEHVWGATLGPETQVFATYPANSSTSSSARPNAWAGNRVLPRVRQHRDALVAIYRIPDGDPPAHVRDLVGHTHAWFPTSQMDEWTQAGPWFAGRVGAGYVAVTCTGGADLETSGPEAAQRLVPRGRGTVWVCQVGRAATHGSFTEFLTGLTTPELAEERATYVTPDGVRLELDWDGPFLVDGVTVDAAGPGEPQPHLDNPYCRTRLGDDELHIRVGEDTHTLDLAAGRRAAPG